MANKVIFILFFIIVGCYYGRGYLIRPYVKGYLYSKIDNAPIQNAFIYVDKKLFYAKSPSNITTDSKGYFFIKGYRDNNRQTMKLMQQFTFDIKSDTLLKVFDISKTKQFQEDIYGKKDTFDIGIIYIEDLEEIRNKR